MILERGKQSNTRSQRAQEVVVVLIEGETKEQKVV